MTVDHCSTAAAVLVLAFNFSVAWRLVLARVHASHWWRKRSAAQVRQACRATNDCTLAICFQDWTVDGCNQPAVMICCETHGLVRIVTDAGHVAAYAAMVRTREGGGR
jgi:hypothetical protein